jgi:N-methylhydantoinase A
LVVRTPMIEITTIGAGGGSIAAIDAGGMLHVGPESAGSRPGPVAYGQGNTRPTLTDANVVLGRINADKPIGGKLARLDVDAAREALSVHIGQKLGLSAEAAAEAVVRVANAKMAGAIRLVSVERGHDPARFAAVPFGGGGALHVGALLRDVGLQSALVPRYPGITSALGCIIADVRHDDVATLNLTLDALDAPALAARMTASGKAASAVVAASNLAIDRIDVVYELDMHYIGQTHTVGVPIAFAADADGNAVTRASVAAAFESAYQQSFSRLLPGIPARIVNLRTAAIGRRPTFDLAALAPGADASRANAARGQRPVWFDGAWHATDIWSRLDLPVGEVIAGPAILEQDDATIVVEPGLQARVDRLGNLIMERLT